MYLVCGSRKCLVNVTQIFFCQRNIKASGIVLHMNYAACLGDGYDIPSTHHPCQHDLRGSGIMPAGYLCQYLVVAQPPFAQRRVSHDRNLMLLAPRDKVIFDASVFQVVEHLIGGTVLAVWQSNDVFHIIHVQIAHSPRAYLTFLLQFHQSTDGLEEWVTPYPV